jgi:hypothetical protein
MSEITLADRRFRLVAVAKDGRWVAHAESAENGDRFGVDCEGMTEAESIERLTRWLEWQSEHTAALDALQDAERAYHRTIAGSAFVNPAEGPTAIELQKESLEKVEEARVRLDEVRARRPD